MMSEKTPESGPESLYETFAGIGGPLRGDALVLCAYCREGHAGYCPNDIVEEGHACPVGWLADEVERRRMEGPDTL